VRRSLYGSAGRMIETYGESHTIFRSSEMPDRRRHRGPHPADAKLFSNAAMKELRAASNDLRWLLNRGYASVSSLKLVGDRYRLTKRQRVAVARCVCTDEAQRQRRQRVVPIDALDNSEVWIDGYNVLTTVEAALAGGLVLPGHDECWRDMASVHGSFRKVEETQTAIELIGRFLDIQGVVLCRWFLDRPVSNSGRLRSLLIDTAERCQWNWMAELVYQPDHVLSEADEIVATADSVILDRCGRWVNLAREVIERHVPDAWVVDFTSEGD
jgi:hypothetical protein